MNGPEGDPSDSTEILRGLLERTKEDGLDPSQVEAIWAGLGPLAGGGVPRGGASSAARIATAYAAKSLALLLAVGGLAAGAFELTHKAPSLDAHAVVGPKPVPAATEAAEAPALPPEPVAMSASAPMAPKPAPLGVAPKPRGASAPPRHEAATGAATPRLDAVRAVEGPTSALAEEGATTAIAEKAPSPPVPGREPQASPPYPTLDEAGQLLKARQELPSDPAATLAIADEDARRHPSSDFAEEREVLAIEALARLGRRSEARRRLALFGERFPRSLHTARLTSLVAP